MPNNVDRVGKRADERLSFDDGLGTSARRCGASRIKRFALLRTEEGDGELSGIILQGDYSRVIATKQQYQQSPVCCSPREKPKNEYGWEACDRGVREMEIVAASTVKIREIISKTTQTQRPISK